jgi:integrase
MALKPASSKYPGVWLNELKNGNTTYYINYRDEHGNPVKKKVGIKTAQSNFTIKDAYDKLIEIKHKLTTGDELPMNLRKKGKLTYQDIYENYLIWAKLNKTTWKHKDQGVWNKHLSHLGKKDPTALKPKDFEDLKNAKLNEGLAPATVKGIFETARHIFNHAIKNELIKGLINPLSGGKVRMPKVDNMKLGFLTQEQAKQLLERLKIENERLHQLTILLLFTGARFSEVASLTWRDVNFDNNMIYFKATKDGNARHVVMTKSVKEVIDKLFFEKTKELIIPTKYGNQYDKMPKLWQQIVDELILDNIDAEKNRITTHSLRHTHASWLAQSGTDILHIKEALGHKKIETTLRYSHLIPNTRHVATIALDFT